MLVVCVLCLVLHVTCFCRGEYMQLDVQRKVIDDDVTHQAYSVSLLDGSGNGKLKCLSMCYHNRRCGFILYHSTRGECHLFDSCIAADSVVTDCSPASDDECWIHVQLERSCCVSSTCAAVATMVSDPVDGREFPLCSGGSVTCKEHSGDMYAVLLPANINSIQQQDLDTIFTDKSTLAAVFQMYDDSVRYAELSQLNDYTQDIILTKEADTIKVTFAPSPESGNSVINGLKVNNQPVSFTSCLADVSGFNSFFQLQAHPTTGEDWAMASDFLNVFTGELVPSSISVDNFFHTEVNFGCCGTRSGTKDSTFVKGINLLIK